MILQNQEMDMALGLGVYIDGFADGVPRKCYPFKLKELTDVNVRLSMFDHVDLYENFKDRNKTVAMAEIFGKAFNTETEEEANDLLHQINADNFAEIVCDVKTVSGISDTQGEPEVDKAFQNKQGKMDWGVAINSIPIYSSISMNEIPEMTLTQLNKILELIGKRINWEYKVDTLSMVKEPKKYLKETEHPLYSDGKDPNKKHMTMDDIAGLMAGGEQ